MLARQLENGILKEHKPGRIIYAGLRHHQNPVFKEEAPELKIISKARYMLASVINMCWEGNFDGPYITALHIQCSEKVTYVSEKQNEDSEKQNEDHVFHEMEKYLRQRYNVSRTNLISEEKALEILPILSNLPGYKASAIMNAGYRRYERGIF